LHTCEAALNLFENSFKKLKNGGVYIIEDVHYSYIENLANKLKKYNPEIIISKNKYFNKYNIKNNNLILIKKL
jgi:predicted methyltransferase